MTKWSFEPDLDVFKQRFDNGELDMAPESEVAPRLTRAQYAALTPEERAERLRAQKVSYNRARYTSHRG